MLDLFKSTHVNHFINCPSTGNTVSGPLSRSLFDAAEREITQWDGYNKTPLYHLTGLARELDIKSIYYKHEGPRFGLGSFKALGGAYAVLRLIQQQLTDTSNRTISVKEIRDGEYHSEASELTIISATDGNHGRSVAWGCTKFGAKCRIYIHAEVSEYRAQVMRDLGAEVVRIDGNYDKAIAQSRYDAEKYGWLIVSDTSWPGYTQAPLDVMSGYGVMAREIVEDLNSNPPSHVFLQGGVGGLAAAVVASFSQQWLEKAPYNIIVEPDLAPCLYTSIKNGTATAINIEQETIMAGLSCGEPSEIAWPILARSAKAFMTIPDKLVAPVVQILANPDKTDTPIEAGESGVAGLCGLICAATQGHLRQSLELDQNSSVVVIGSEGITDPQIYNSLMQNSNN